VARTGGVRVVEDPARHHDGLRRAGAEVLGALEHALHDTVPTAVEGLDHPLEAVS